MRVLLQAHFLIGFFFLNQNEASFYLIHFSTLEKRSDKIRAQNLKDPEQGLDGERPGTNPQRIWRQVGQFERKHAPS